MRPETAEWVEKAEADFRTANRENVATEWPNYDAVCFHAQQCAEKYLKARLVEAGQTPLKIHDLEALLSQVLSLEPEWEQMRVELQRLTGMAVEVRYPGASADAHDAGEAVNTARRVREMARSALGLAH